MTLNKFTNQMAFFGAALDALNDSQAIGIKRSYLETLSQADEPRKDFRDPYAVFKRVAGQYVRQMGHRVLGRFKVESFLSPKPQLTDFELIRSETFDFFLRQDGFRTFAEMVMQFVELNVFPHRPVMIGVDHSLTGGVLMAISKKTRPQDLGVVIFDVHTDAVPFSLRRGMAEYAYEKGISRQKPTPSQDYEACYTTGNFLLQLIDMGAILPGNVIIIGAGDVGDYFRGQEDERIREYVRHYQQLQERGVKVIGQSVLNGRDRVDLKTILNLMECSNLYISLDVDVSAQCDVLAARFIELKGTPMRIIEQIVGQLVGLISQERFMLVGFDIMEIDVHKIGARLSSGIQDRTTMLIRRMVSKLVSRVHL